MSDDNAEGRAGSDPVTKKEFNKFKEEQAARDTTQDARLTALEETATEPPPIDPEPPEPPEPGDVSPDGTSATSPGTVLVSAAGNSFELCKMAVAAHDFGIRYNGEIDPATHHVSQLYAKAGLIYQQAGGNYWYCSNDDGTWRSASDPTREDPGPVDPPISIETPPGEGPRVIALYTSSLDGTTWNWGTGNDAKLEEGIATWEAGSGIRINAYGVFPLWGSQLDWDDNLGGALWAMRNNGQNSKDYVPVVGIKFFWNDSPPDYWGWNSVEGLTACADGRYDEMYRGCVDQCLHNGVKTVIFRPSYEGNFSYMPDFETWDAHGQAEWARAHTHVGRLMIERGKEIGVNVFIAYNPSLGRGCGPTTSNLPEPDSYQFLGFDAYNGYYGDAAGWQNDVDERKRFWSDDYFGAREMIACAKSLGKPLFWGEVGAGLRPDGHGLHDSYHFWDWLAEMIGECRAQGVGYVGMQIWDVSPSDIAARHSDGVQPPCMDKIRQYFADGTFVPDSLWTSETRATVPQATRAPMPRSSYDEAESRAFCQRPDVQAMFKEKTRAASQHARQRLADAVLNAPERFRRKPRELEQDGPGPRREA